MLDIFVFNIIFINYFMLYFLNTPIYKHQLYALIFNFSISLILLISASAIKYEGVSDFDNVNTIYGSYSYILLFYVIYMILSALLSLSQVLQKKLMDFNFIIPKEITNYNSYEILIPIIHRYSKEISRGFICVEKYQYLSDNIDVIIMSSKDLL